MKSYLDYKTDQMVLEKRTYELVYIVFKSSCSISVAFIYVKLRKIVKHFYTRKIFPAKI